MGVEIERKFLLNNESWKQFAEPGKQIKQGYLNSTPERTVRVRLIDEKGILTVKGKTEGATRKEFEYEIPSEEALELLNLCERPLIEKTRYLVHQKNVTWEIDIFEGDNDGLVIAEVELDSEDQQLDIPDWVGNEVTDDTRYYNSSLIKLPFKDW